MSPEWSEERTEGQSREGIERKKERNAVNAKEANERGQPLDRPGRI